MSDLELKIDLYLGKTKRKLDKLTLEILDIHKNNVIDQWSYCVKLTGAIDELSKQEANTPFDCITLGMSYLRQSLRSYLEENHRVKIYEKYEGSFEITNIDNVFWTHDCITDEMEEMINWAKENGFKKSDQ